MKIMHNVFFLKDTSFNYFILNFHEVLLLTKGDIGLDISRVFLSIRWWTFPRPKDASESKNSTRF